MFTGIVTAVGRVTTARSDAKRQGGLTLAIRAPYRGLRAGESVAVSGACLTVERVVRGGFQVHAVRTTLDRTLIGEWDAGRRVNLERAVRASDRLGGHWVQGHVDGVGTVSRVDRDGDDVWVAELTVPAEVAAVTIPRGSITVDGVSLTVHAVPEPGRVAVALIPHTRDHTTLGGVQQGDRVHVEGDVLAKYVRQLWPSGR